MTHLTQDIAYTLAATSQFLNEAHKAVSFRESNGFNDENDRSQFPSWVQNQLRSLRKNMLHPQDLRIAERVDLIAQATAQQQLVDNIYQRAMTICSRAPLPALHTPIASSACSVQASSTVGLMTKAQIFQQMRDPSHSGSYICFYNAFFHLGIYDDCQRDQVKAKEAAAKDNVATLQDLTYRFGNFDEDRNQKRFEFGGVHYKTREGCFQAQKCDYQVQGANALRKEQFADLSGEEAFQLSKGIQMATDSVKRWDVERDNVMLNVIRAEVGQNPELKAVLLSSGSAYLNEFRANPLANDKYWSDAGDGTGENKLGITLMKVRGEIRGAGIVPKPKELQDLQNMLKVNIAASSLSSSSAHAIKACSLAGCHKPCFVDPQTGSVLDYCGRSHAQQANFKH